jgi:hypothetical protein
MNVQRHIFGSEKGYRTLAASRSVRDCECRELEHLSIGQGFTPEFLDSLAGSPAWIICSIGERRVLARVGLGPPDEYGRPTLQQFSLLVEKDDWDTRLYGDIRPLIQCRQLWRVGRDYRLDSVDLSDREVPLPTVSPRRAARLMQLVSALEIAQSRGEQLILAEDTCSLKDFRNLWLVLPHALRDRYTGVYRSFGSVSAGITCVAAQAADRSRMNAVPPSQLSSYAIALRDGGLGNGPVPLNLIAGYSSFGMPTSPRGCADALETKQERPAACEVSCAFVEELT